MDATSTSAGRSTADADIFEHLHRDHQAEIGLLQQLSAAASATQRDRLFASVKVELAAHVKAEDAVFYQALEHAAGEVVTAARYEHKNIAALLERLDTLPKDGDAWLAMLAELRKAVEHHIEHDESRLFAAARRVLTTKQQCELAPRMTEGEVDSKAIAGEAHAATREAQKHT